MILQTEDVILRPLSENDAGAMATMANNKKVWDNLRDALPFPYTYQDALDFINMSGQEEPVLTFAVEYKREFAGVIGLIKQYDIYRLSAELGFWLGEPFWNKGIATQAVKLIVQYGFENLNLVRIYGCVFEFNKASQRVLDKAGFSLEATFKKAIIKNDRIGNECRYSIIN